MAKLISTSARKTKSFRGAKAFVAKSPIKFEDSDHESSIKKGEKFYLKKLGTRYYLIDVETEGGKEVWYQFKIEKKDFDSFRTKHDKASEQPKAKAKPKAKPKAKAKAKAKPKSAPAKTGSRGLTGKLRTLRKSGIKTAKQFNDLATNLKDSGYKAQKPVKKNGIYRLTMKNKSGKSVTFRFKNPKNKHVRKLLGK